MDNVFGGKKKEIGAVSLMALLGSVAVVKTRRHSFPPLKGGK
jgi:hypothetical protein